MTTSGSIRFQDAATDRAKRVRTRALLMDCAISEFASKGIVQTSVDDIATKAGVSHGTFYYHFSNKAEIVESVGRAVAAGFVTIADQEIRHISTGPERVALATQVFIDMASAIPNWGSLVVDALANMGKFNEHISRGIRKDVLIGIRGGAFSAKPSPLLFNSLLAVVGTAVRARLETPDDPSIGLFAADIVLRVLGVPIEEAMELPQRVKSQQDRDHWHSPEAIQVHLNAVMPQLLLEILTDQIALQQKNSA